jgi:hypothetical protein
MAENRASSRCAAELTLSKVRAFEVSGKADFYAAAPARRQVSPACKVVLEEERARRRFDSLYIVVRAVAADGYAFTLQQPAGADSNLTARLDPAPAPEGGWRVKRTGNASFEIERDPTVAAATTNYIAAEIVKLERWEMSTLVSAGPATLSVARPGDADVDALRRQPARFQPVLVDLVGSTTRLSTNGGSATILLSNASNRRSANLTLCRSVVARFTVASMERVRASLEAEARGAARALRPIYWPVTAPTQPACEARLAAYNFARAAVMRQKFDISTAGPHLLVLKADDSAAGVIDLTNWPATDYDKIVVLFRDGFSQQAVWDRGRYPPARRDGFIRQAFDGIVAPHVKAAMQILNRSNACANSDATDSACG